MYLYRKQLYLIMYLDLKYYKGLMQLSKQNFYHTH